MRGSLAVRHDEKLPTYLYYKCPQDWARQDNVIVASRTHFERREGKLGEPGSNGSGLRLAGHNSDICRKKTDRQWADLSRTLELFDPTQGSWGVSLP
jgi:hypothetical protein